MSEAQNVSSVLLGLVDRFIILAWLCFVALGCGFVIAISLAPLVILLKVIFSG